MALQKWNTDITTSSMCKMYRIFFNYLISITICYIQITDIISLSKLRCAKHIYIHDSDVCTLCNLDVCGNEYHYVLICPLFKHSRTMYLKPYFYTRASLYTFEKLSVRQVGKLSKLANIFEPF